MITPHAHRLDELAISVAALGYYAFVALPDAVSDLCAVTQFDLAIVLTDVAAADRDRVAQIAAIQARLLTLDGVGEATFNEQVRTRLGR